jgi:hypothetical protein
MRIRSPFVDCQIEPEDAFVICDNEDRPNVFNARPAGSAAKRR